MKAQRTKGPGPVASSPVKAWRRYSPIVCWRPPLLTERGMSPMVVGTTTAAQRGMASPMAASLPIPERPSRIASTSATIATRSVAWAPPIQLPASTAVVVATIRPRAMR